MSGTFAETRTLPSAVCRSRGVLIINADDWGRDRQTTDRIFDCMRRGTVSSASGMVFMDDSERAAAIAREYKFDVGLHLNFTTPFTAAATPPRLAEHQRRLAGFLRRSRLAPLLFHPLLKDSFRYVAETQRAEFLRLYGRAPERIDGHHHMHLAANVLVAGLLPRGTIVRRNFSFEAGEKSFANRAYRGWVDARLARRHRLTDFFFSLPPISPRERLERIFRMAHDFAIELETHPAHPDEYRFLESGEIFRWTGGIEVAPGYTLPAICGKTQ